MVELNFNFKFSFQNVKMLFLEVVGEYIIKQNHEFNIYIYIYNCIIAKTNNLKLLISLGLFRLF